VTQLISLITITERHEMVTHKHPFAGRETRDIVAAGKALNVDSPKHQQS